MHHMVYLFTPQLLLVLTVPTHRGMASLSWAGWLVIFSGGLPTCRWLPIPVLTGLNVEQLHWSRSMHYHLIVFLSLIHSYNTSKAHPITTPCPKKGATKLMVLTSSNLNRFSKFFTIGKRRKFLTNPMYYFPLHLKYVATLPLVSSNLSQIWKKMQTKIVTWTS